MSERIRTILIKKVLTVLQKLNKCVKNFRWNIISFKNKGLKSENVLI